MCPRYASVLEVHKRLHVRPLLPRMAGLLILLPILFVGATWALANDGDRGQLSPYRDGIVLLAFRGGTHPAQQKAVLSSVGAREIKRIGVGVHVVAVKSGQVFSAIHSLKAFQMVQYAEPDYLQRLSAGTLPNDTSVGLQWAVQNTGQSANGTSGTSGADERLLAAWSITTGTNSVVIAELDTGVQYSHPDLFTNMWNNPGGIGGCAAATHGYNVLSSSCDPMDDDTDYGGHGTHVAGIMGAVGNDAAGTAGVNWTTSIMAVKWVNSSGTGATSDLITGMDWVVSAKQAGVNVRVANDSQTWAGTAFSQALSDEIDLLGSNDILFVTASGNTAQDNDVVPRYPCSYERPTMICVAASDQNDNLWSSANYGPKSDQLAAPGVNIYSTLRVSNYGYISGGSMASPQVAGTAALILSLGYQSVANLRTMILNNVDVLSSLSGLVATSGRLNVCKAVPGCSTAVAGKPANSIPPVVTSLPSQGGLLGASTGVWTGIPSTYTYQWSRCDQNGLNCATIPGATGQTYALLASADTSAILMVTVTASNASGSTAAQSSASGNVASGTSPSAIASSIVSGATISGSVNWTATPARSEQFVQFYIDGVLTETDSSSPYVFTTGASGLLDTTTLSNGPHVLGARALFTDNRTYDFYGEPVTVSNLPKNTALPVISGTILSGQTLSTTNGVWNANSIPTGFSYQWEHCDSNGLNCSAIAGATRSSYILSGADANFTIRSAVTASSSAGSATAVSAQTTVVPPLSAILVDSGGAAYTDTLGNSWSADTGFTGGSTASTTSNIANTPDPKLYQTERYGNSSYQFTVPNGGYNVVLKFAEIYWTTTGQRIFNVSINGTQVLTNFDIVAAAGAALTAIDKTFPVTVTNGQVTIQFTSGSADLPKVSAIEIGSASGVFVQVNPTTASLYASQQQQFTASVTGTTNTAVNWTYSPQIGTLTANGLYTAPTSVTTAQTVSVTATSQADTTKSAVATVNLLPPAGSFNPIFVNSGGGAYTDILGNSWSADTGFTGGQVASTTKSIANTPDPALYQTERYGNSSYVFNVPSGKYTVILKFAEIYWTSSGKRLFNTSIDGTQVLTNFDIVAAAGAAFTAIDKSFPVTVTGSSITIQFTTGSADLPKISAIEIKVASGVGIQINPATASLLASQSKQFGATVTGTTNLGVTWTYSPQVGTLVTSGATAGLYTAPASITTAQTVRVTATSVADPTQASSATVSLVPPFSPILVNSGGAAYTDTLGNSWSADTGFTGGSTASTTSNIANTPDPKLYQTERYGNSSYQFAVPNGSYNVVLKFAEIYWTKTGQRIFNVSVNGTQVLTNFDIIAAAGAALTAIDKTFPVTVTNGQVTIQFTSGSADLPKVSAIEIH